MKQKLLYFLRLRALMLVALVCTAFTGVWADEPFYTLDTTGDITTGNNSYGNMGRVTLDGLTWAFQGNGTMHPWRLGGKNLDGKERSVYIETPVKVAVSKIDLTVGTADDITVNSLKLIVTTPSVRYLPLKIWRQLILNRTALFPSRQQMGKTGFQMLTISLSLMYPVAQLLTNLCNSQKWRSIATLLHRM